jgi:hypothetical protein
MRLLGGCAAKQPQGADEQLPAAFDNKQLFACCLPSISGYALAE